MKKYIITYWRNCIIDSAFINADDEEQAKYKLLHAFRKKKIQPEIIDVKEVRKDV